MEVGIFEGRNRFSELVEAAERGEEVLVLRRGKPAVRIVSAAPVEDRVALHMAALDRADALRAEIRDHLGRSFTHDELIAARDEGRR